MATYFRNVENDGYWVAGESYTFEVWTRETTFPYGYYYNLIVNAGFGGYALLEDEIAFADGYTISPTTWTWAPADDYPWEGDGTVGIQVTAQDPESLTSQQYEDGAWIECTVTIDSDLTLGNYDLVHVYYKMNESPYTYTLLGTETLNITVLGVGQSAPLAAYPIGRPDDYSDNIDKHWDEESDVWVADGAWDIQKLGGGRYKQQILAVNNRGQIYFGDT